MSKQMYSIREKATGKEISCDWQNAFELVNHGFWEWAKGDGRKEFKRATIEARQSNPDPSGFRDPIDDRDDESLDDDEEETPAPPAPRTIPVEQVSQTQIVIDEADDIDNMTKEELVEYAAEKLQLKLDKRTGQKTMVSAIRAKLEGGTE